MTGDADGVHVKIAVIGGGAAGLTCAWLLAQDHDIMLFEKDERLGGHAHTVRVELLGETVEIDAGFQFFGPGDSYAMFNRLLDILSVPRRSYPATLTVFDSQSGRAVALPPSRDGRPVWSSLRPSDVTDMLRFRRFLAGIPAFLARHDRSMTIAQYLEREHVPSSFADRLLYPLLLSFWCVELDDFKGFAAYNALYYLGANMPNGLTPPPQSDIPGGMRVYVEAIARAIGDERIRTDAGIHRIDRIESGYVVTDTHGRTAQVDQVVIATDAQQALRLVEGMPGLGERAEQLRRFRCFDTRIAIHGDRRLMPRNERAWSVVNARWDGVHSSLSIWNPRRGLPLFKSWVTFDASPPEPLYATATYRHGMIDLTYFDAQQRLRTLQGSHGVWLAGLYTDDADSHESAIRSAITVARALAPGSARLAMLLAASG
jgi:predicted NAD/FAD-binding protein